MLQAAVGKAQDVGNATGDLSWMVRNENEGGGGAGDDAINGRQERAALRHIEPLAGFIEDEEARLVDGTAGQEHQPLPAEREFAEGRISVSA